MRQFFYLSIFCAVALTACTDSFKKGDNGLEYKIIPDGSGKKVGYGNYMQLHFKQVYKGKIDTVIGDSRDFMPRINILDSVSTPPEYFKILKQLRKGDSIVLRTRVDSFYKRSPGAMPSFMKKSDFVYTSLKIINIFETKAEADSANKAELKMGRPRLFKKQWTAIGNELMKNKTQIDKDDNIIKEYLAKNNIKAIKTNWGTYIAISNEGTGEKISAEDRVTVNYSGHILDSTTVFDSNNDPKFQHVSPYPVSVGQLNEVIIGWYDALLQLKKGCKATLYIPSTLAYGTEGKAPDISADKILVFDFEVLTVENEEEILKKQEEAQLKNLEEQRRKSDSLQKAQPNKR